MAPVAGFTALVDGSALGLPDVRCSAPSGVQTYIQIFSLLVKAQWLHLEPLLSSPFTMAICTY